MTQNCSINIHFDKTIYRLNFNLERTWKFDNQDKAKSWFEGLFKKFFAEHSEISPVDVKAVNSQGIWLKDGRHFERPELFLLRSGQAVDSAHKVDAVRKVQLPEATINEPHPARKEPSIGDATFKFLNPEEPHVLDTIPPKPRWVAAISNKHTHISLAKLESECLIAHASSHGQPAKTKVQDTERGTQLGTETRQNYRMTLSLQGIMETLFGKTVQSDEIFAKNSPLNGCQTQDGEIHGAVTASSNRFADTIQLLRKTETQDGTSDCYVGRVNSEKQAKEMAEFIFRGEIDHFSEGLAKGLHRRKDGVYELTFCVQSLLTMRGEQYSMFKKELAAYEALAGQTLVIEHQGKTYRVLVKPVPVAAQQLNIMNYLEQISSWLSGKDRADSQTAKANKILEPLVQQKLQQLKESGEIDKAAKLQNTWDSLQDASLSKPWEKILARAYLLHLLDLPEVIHCKSNTDRTGGIAVPLVFAMKEWLRAGHEIPMVDGRTRISALVDYYQTDRTGQRVYPFRELFAFKMLQELKVSEFSRGVTGFKLQECGVLNPSLADLLPERYLDRSFFAIRDRLSAYGLSARLLYPAQ